MVGNLGLFLVVLRTMASHWEKPRPFDLLEKKLKLDGKQCNNKDARKNCLQQIFFSFFFVVFFKMIAKRKIRIGGYLINIMLLE